MIEYYEFGGLNFEWDDQKANKIQQNHNVTFKEACTIFFDFDEFTTIDDRFHYNEERYITIGMSYKARLLVVSWTQRQDNIRLITAMKADKKYEQRYRQG